MGNECLIVLLEFEDV